MDVQFRDRAVYLPGEDALVLADLHAGRDAASNVELPLGERADLLTRLESLLLTFEPSTVVVAGDVLHAFDHVPERVEGTLEDLSTAVADAGADLILVSGNHDAMLDSLDLPAGIETAPATEHGLGDTLVCHGDAHPNGDADRYDRYVVGHDHPTIEIEGTRHACLLVGPGTYRGADLLVLPAFNRLAPGTPVNGMTTRDFQSPLVTDADALRPVVWDDDSGECLSFPPLGEFRELL